MSITLGEHIFSNIESNEYLQEIFDAILNNYSIKLFGFNQSPILIEQNSTRCGHKK